MSNDKLSSIYRQALEYVRNTNGGATVDIFIEDHEPIGNELWNDLVRFIAVRDGKIYLNDWGNEVLYNEQR